MQGLKRRVEAAIAQARVHFGCIAEAMFKNITNAELFTLITVERRIADIQAAGEMATVAGRCQKARIDMVEVAAFGVVLVETEQRQARVLIRLPRYCRCDGKAPFVHVIIARTGLAADCADRILQDAIIIKRATALYTALDPAMAAGLDADLAG
ncbi:hypothetical protein D3C87_1641560 [compost metagenome]